MQTTPDLDSRQQLAVSIHRVLRSEIPARAPEDDLRTSIEAALLEEAQRNESTLAHLRVAATAAVAISYLIGYATGPEALSGASSWGAVALHVLGALWIAAATAIAVALRRGWYRPWLRRAAPAADGFMIVLASLLFGSVSGSPREPAGAGAAVAAALGALVATSGALRLTRSAVQLSTGLALGSVGAVTILLRLPAVYVSVLTTSVVIGGALGIVVMRLVRRAVTNQVGRTAMDRLYGEARQVIDAREDVLRVVSHDLRNPLNTIIMGTTSLLMDPLTDLQARQLRIVKRAAERMNRLIQDLLSVSIIEAGRLSVEPRPIDLRAIFSEVIDTLGPLARERSIELETVLPIDLPDVRADPARVVQVFSNLVGNAIKFTPGRGRVTLAAVVTGGSVRCDVVDTGPGIPPEQLPKIFARFWQANHSDRRGIGLGLSIAKGIIEAHGGRLWVTSRVGEGSIFSFTLVTAG